jgi:8-oxo-dGTP pyrophosphatase MutT (NUDIX family)
MAPKNEPSPGSVRTQVSALPLQRDKQGNLRVLLITSRETRRWIIPKGWPMKGLDDSEAAAREALEEAGVTGRVRGKPIGTYQYWKRGVASFELCEVKVYPLEVERQLETWREKGQREAHWFSPEDAADLVEEPGLRALIATLRA